MPNKDRNIPKRRFKEFENADAWELRKLWEISTHRGGTAIENHFSEDGKYKVISIGSYGLDNKYIDQKIRAVENEVTRSKVVNKNELTMVLNDKTANGNIIGRCLLIEADDEFVINQRTEIISFNSVIYPKFAYVVLNGAFREQVKKIVQGGTQIYVNYSSVEQLYLSLPTLPEQEAIGTFFSTLDRHITLHQRKLDKLKSVKQAYLSEMFPAEGERVPKRRFPGFTDAWELHKLGEVGTVAMCRRIFKEQTSEHGEIPFYKIGTFGGPPDAFIARELFEEFKDKYSYPNIGDILISASGSIGRAVEFLGEDEYFQDSNIVWLKHDGKINNIFLKQFYSIVKWSGIEGSTIKRLYNENILNTEIALPTLAEQEAIGSFFSTLDRHITLHQRKLDKLKSVKQAYLSEMFPAEGERVPKRRFPGFTDDWELRRFSELAEIRRGLTYSPVNIRLEGIRVLRSSNIDEDTFTFGEDDVFVDKGVVKSPLVKEGDILITAANGSSRLVGKHTIIKDLPENSAIHGGFMLLASCRNPEFINSLMSSAWYTKFINLYVAGGNGAIGNLNKHDLDEQNVLVPSQKEQSAIGTFFSTLDQHITLHQRKS